MGSLKSVLLHTLAIILLIPCITAFSEGDDWTVNLFGFIYIIMLYCISWTKMGKKFLLAYFREIIRIENKIWH